MDGFTALRPWRYWMDWMGWMDGWILTALRVHCSVSRTLGGGVAPKRFLSPVCPLLFSSAIFHTV